MDQHNSEYIAPCDERIAFISGFTGSNGLTVVTESDARMWTDGRYYLQAEKQLETGWTLMKWEKDVPMWYDWVCTELPKGAKVGLDLTQYPGTPLTQRAKTLSDKGLVLEP